jgi:transposase-like protein
MTSKQHTEAERLSIVLEAVKSDWEGMKSVAARYGITIPTLMAWITKHESGQGLDRKRKPYPSVPVERYLNYIKNHPDASLETAGRALGLSKQRIHQIIQEIKRHADRND